MKVTIDLDLTPEEARKVMGLPDVEPLQREMMDKVREKMDESFNSMSSPEQMMNHFLPIGMQGMEQMQQFMSNMTKAAGSSSTKKDD